MSITILSQDDINKLAAGEQIHEALQGLKELIENSLDAGSDSIKVTADEKLIIIEDNGNGIQEEDFPLLCARFATSKIKKFDDIYNIESFGFRGEALCALSYVSDLKIESVFQNKYTCGVFKNSQMTNIHSFQQNNKSYTKIKARFSNLEVNVIQLVQLVKAISLINYRVEFYISTPKHQINIPAFKNTEQAIKNWLISEKIETQYIRLVNNQFIEENNINNEKSIYQISYEDHQNNFNLNLYFAQSDSFQGQSYTIIVNNRLLQDQFSFFVKQQLKQLFPQKQLQFRFVLNITITNSHEIDFNCHPRKQKVLLTKQQYIYDAISIQFREFKTHLNQNVITPNQQSQINHQNEVTVQHKQGVLQKTRITPKQNQICYQLDKSSQLRSASPVSISSQEEQLSQYAIFTKLVIKYQLLSKCDAQTFLNKLSQESYQLFEVIPQQVLQQIQFEILNNNSCSINSNDSIYLQLNCNLFKIKVQTFISIILSYFQIKHYYRPRTNIAQNVQLLNPQLSLEEVQQTNVSGSKLLLNLHISKNIILLNTLHYLQNLRIFSEANVINFEDLQCVDLETHVEQQCLSIFEILNIYNIRLLNTYITLTNKSLQLTNSDLNVLTDILTQNRQILTYILLQEKTINNNKEIQVLTHTQILKLFDRV